MYIHILDTYMTICMHVRVSVVAKRCNRIQFPIRVNKYFMRQIEARSSNMEGNVLEGLSTITVSISLGLHLYCNILCLNSFWSEELSHILFLQFYLSMIIFYNYSQMLWLTTNINVKYNIRYHETHYHKIIKYRWVM